MWWMSGTIPPVYLRVYCCCIQCCIKSAYSLFSEAARRFAGAKIFFALRHMPSLSSSHRSGTLSLAEVLNMNSWTTCFGLDSAQNLSAIPLWQSTQQRNLLAMPGFRSIARRLKINRCLTWSRYLETTLCCKGDTETFYLRQKSCTAYSIFLGPTKFPRDCRYLQILRLVV